MQRIQIARGEIGVRQEALPLLAGEYFLDTSVSTGYQLYIGTGGDGNYEWKSQEITDDQGKLIGGPNGAYKKIGTTNPLGFFEAHAANTNPGYFITSLPTNLYIAKAEIPLSSAQAAKFENVNTENGGSTPVIKINDIIAYTGYKWVKFNNAGGAANESEFFNKVTQAPQTVGAISVQDAIIALDSQKLAYAGELFNDSSIPSGSFATLKAGSDFSFEIRATADGEVASTFNTFKKLGEVEGTVWLVNVDCTINGVKYEQGDFLTVKSDLPWSERTADDPDHPNERYLHNDEVIITHIPGGTHSPDKMYIDGHELTRSTHGAHVYATDDRDYAITNVKEALQVAFHTKADLDPTTGKLLISQLPDTIIGAMEYQGTIGDDSLAENAEFVTLSDGTQATTDFNLPTAENKEAGHDSDADNDGRDEDHPNGLVKGDYWIFSSNKKWDITAQVANEVITASGLSEADGKYYISNGDWLVYNGSGKWSVIDNTDAFIGIKVGDDNVQGLVELAGKTRDEDAGLVETAVSVEGQKVTIEAPQAVLAKDGVQANVIYKSGSATNRTAVASNLVDDGTDLTITEEEGIKLVTGEDGSQITATIKGNDADVELKLPNVDTTLAGNEDLGIVDAAEGKKGTDWFATMYRTENNRKVIRDSFLQFLGDETEDGKLRLSGFTIKDETSRNHKVEFRMSSDTGHTIQVLPRLSGYLLNSNSVIDCGIWNSENPTGFAPTEGYVSESDKIFKNRTLYDYPDSSEYQTVEEADNDDLLTPLEREEIEAIITNN